MILSFIKLDINILSDTKIKLIRSMKNGDSIMVLWVGLLCLAMKSSNPGMIEMGDGIPFTYEILSTELGINVKIIKTGMEIFKKYKMIEEFNDGEIFITNFNKHQEVDKIISSKEKSKISSRAYREKLKNKISGVTVTSLSRDDDVLIRDRIEEEEDIETEEEKETEPEKKPDITKNKRFRKPTIEELEKYCSTNGKDINPEAFFDYYDTNGWVVGKNKTPMKDWKAAIRTWQRREDDKKPKPIKQEEMPIDCYMGVPNYRNDKYDELAKYGKQPIDYFFWSEYSFNLLSDEKKRRVYLNTLEFLKTYDPTYELNYEIPG